MGTKADGVVTRGRSRGLAYLHLSRVSNLPTVWTNVLAGITVAGAAHAPAAVYVAASLFYTGGMFLNDAFDAPVDARSRPDRPIPAGAVPRAEAFAVGAGLIASGEAMLGVTAAAAAVWGLALAAAIVFYDYRHKGKAYGPVVMGLCRALVYLMAAAAVATMTEAVLLAAATMWAYVLSLTWVAKQAGERAGTLVPWLIAGISLVDAAIIAASGEPALAMLAAGGFALALALQRVVPGH